MKTASQIGLETVLSIGEKFNMALSDFFNVSEFVETLLDKIMGKEAYASEMVFVLNYKQQYLIER